MNTSNSSKTTGEKTPHWAVPAKRWQSGTDVMHLGPARRLERTNADGSEYHVEAELTQLEEGGSFVTDPYFTVRAGGEGSEDAVFTVDVSEIDILMGWFYQLAEKAQHLKPKP